MILFGYAKPSDIEIVKVSFPCLYIVHLMAIGPSVKCMLVLGFPWTNSL